MRRAITPVWMLRTIATKLSSGERTVAVPIEAAFKLDREELSAIHAVFGPNSLRTAELVRSKNYNGERFFSLELNEAEALEYVVTNADFSEQTNDALVEIPRTVNDLTQALLTQEQTSEVKRVLSVLLAAQKGETRWLHLRYVS